MAKQKQRRKFKHLTAVEITRLKELWKQGKKPKEIAEVLGCSARTVRRYIYGKYLNKRQERKSQRAQNSQALNLPTLIDTGNYRTSPVTDRPVELPDFSADPLEILIALEELEELGELD